MIALKIINGWHTNLLVFYASLWLDNTIYKFNLLFYVMLLVPCFILEKNFKVNFYDVGDETSRALADTSNQIDFELEETELHN